jgi:hypothetical protein
MLEFINDAIKCKICFKKLVNPVFLPCGKTICACHEAEFIRKEVQDENKEQIEPCFSCNQVHKLKENEHFPVNEVAKHFLTLQVDQLDFDYMYKKVHKTLEQLNNNLLDYEKFEKEPEEILFDYFSTIENSINMARDEFVQIIDDKTLELFNEVESYEEECKENLREAHSKLEPKPLDTFKSEIKEWEEKVNLLKIDEQLWSIAIGSINERINETQDLIEG